MRTIFRSWRIHTHKKGKSIMKFMMSPLLVSIICMFFLVNAANCSSLHVDKLKSCLIDHNVHNVSLFPTSANDPSPYFKFLNFSIQNLRFSGPAVPKPVAIVIPDTKNQLISTVLCCRKSGPWEIRVRCGGHSYEGSSYVADGGSPFVLIDMMSLDRVSVDLGSEAAWVEGGATLGQTYYGISRMSPVHGFSAGSCPTVGSGGHIGGGGFGLLSRKYGLAADNVVDALLIDAGGRVLDRRTMGEEVFWAIRGGGGGVWGVVYAWKVRLVRVPPTVTSFIISRAGSKGCDVLELVDKWQRVAPALVDDFYLSVFVGFGLPEAEGVGISATFKGFYLGNKSEAVSILERVFPELRVDEEDYREMSWIESIVYFSGLSNGSEMSLTDRFLHEKTYFKAKSDYVRHPIRRSGLQEAIKILEKEPKGYVILDPYGGAMHRISSQSIAFPHRKGNLFTIQYLVEWGEGDNGRSKDYIEWIRGFYGAMTHYVSSGPRAAYVNYIDFDLGVMEYVKSSGDGGDDVERARVWGEKYFLKNYDRLVRAKTLIDPLNVFRNQQGIPPLVNASWKAQT